MDVFLVGVFDIIGVLLIGSFVDFFVGLLLLFLVLFLLLLFEGVLLMVKF